MSVILQSLATAAVVLLGVVSVASGQAVGPEEGTPTGTVGPGGGGAHDMVDPPLPLEQGGAHDPVPRGLRSDAAFSPAQCENFLSDWPDLPPERQEEMKDIREDCEARLATRDTNE